MYEIATFNLTDIQLQIDFANFGFQNEYGIIVGFHVDNVVNSAAESMYVFNR